jgi:hypothetical protein
VDGVFIREVASARAGVSLAREEVNLSISQKKLSYAMPTWAILKSLKLRGSELMVCGECDLRSCGVGIWRSCLVGNAVPIRTLKVQANPVI